MFSAITNRLNAISAINAKDLFRELFNDKEFTDLIVRLNTEGEQTSQLWNGFDSEGLKLSDWHPYAHNTIIGVPGKYQGKIDKGQPFDRVTLKDTGDFYKSFKTYWSGLGDGSIVITANPYKTDDSGETTNLIEEWGKDIIGLDEQNIGVLRDFARKKIKSIVLNQIRQAA